MKTPSPLHAAHADELDEAFLRLQRLLPPTLARMMRWLHDPRSRAVRIPLGILFVLASFLWFLPVLGLEMLPIGLLLLAQDIPILRAPVGKLTLKVLDMAERLVQRWKKKRRQ